MLITRPRFYITDNNVMMASYPRNLLSIFFLCAGALFMATHGLVTQPEPYDLQLTSVTRQVSADNSQVEVIVEFTSSTRPQTKWTYADADFETAFLHTSRLVYSNGRGQASVTFSDIKLVSLHIGNFDTHYLHLFVKTADHSNVTKSLNTQLSEFTTGYDFTYTRGESFDVVAKVPPPGPANHDDYTARVSHYYMDQESRKVITSMDYLDYSHGSFYYVDKTYRDDGATVKLSFDTSQKDINGFFRILVMSSPFDVSSKELVDDLWEYGYISVHNGSTPGPFPEGYAYVRTHEDRPQTCEWTARVCSLFCYGYANYIAEAKIFKEDDSGQFQELPDVVVHRSTSHSMTFHVELHPFSDYPGTFLCEITNRAGISANKTVTTK